jgi:hypothetical protein
MSQKWVVGLGIALVSVLSLPASAAIVRGELLIAPMVGTGVPLGDYPTTSFGDKIRVGFGFGAQAERMVTDRIGLGAAFAVNFNDFDNQFLQDTFTVLRKGRPGPKPDYNWRTMQLSAHGRYYFNPQATVNVFGQLGFGAYVNKFSSNSRYDRSNGVVYEVKRSDTRTDLGISAGPGVSIRTSEYTRLVLEAIVNNVFTGGKNLRFVNFGAGLVFRIPAQ